MKVALVSDSHDNMHAVEKFLNAVDKDITTVLHLGDIVSPFVLRMFFKFEYYGVFGNNDGERLLLKKIADENGMHLEPQPCVVELEGKKILLYHGSGSVEKTRRIVESFARSGDYDFVFYGHTHIVDNRRIGNALLLNPGELCGYLTGKSSFAIVDLDTGDVDIIKL